MYFHTPSRCDDRLVTTSPSYCPTEDDVVKDDILYLCCLPDGDVELAVLDFGIRCLEYGHILDEEYVTDGSDALIYDDAKVANDARLPDGLVEL